MALFQRFLLPCSSSLFVCLPGRGFPFVNSPWRKVRPTQQIGDAFLGVSTNGVWMIGMIWMGMVLMDDLDDMNG